MHKWDHIDPASLYSLLWQLLSRNDNRWEGVSRDQWPETLVTILECSRRLREQRQTLHKTVWGQTETVSDLSIYSASI